LADGRVGEIEPRDGRAAGPCRAVEAVIRVGLIDRRVEPIPPMARGERAAEITVPVGRVEDVLLVPLLGARVGEVVRAARDAEAGGRCVVEMAAERVRAVRGPRHRYAIAGELVVFSEQVEERVPTTAGRNKPVFAADILAGLLEERVVQRQVAAAIDRPE